MKKLLYFASVVVIGMLVAYPAKAYVLIEGEKAFSEFTQRYPMNRDAGDALRRLATLDVAGILERAQTPSKRGEKRSLLVTFYAHVINDAEPQVLLRAGNAILETDEFERSSVFADALSYSSHPEREQMIEEIDFPDSWRPTISSRGSYDYEAMFIKSGLSMDVQWAAYFGSGKPVFARKIIEKLGPLRTRDELTAYINTLKPGIEVGNTDAKQKLADAVLSAAAQYSLTANAKVIPPLREYMIEYLHKIDSADKQKTDVALVLAVILAQTNP